MHDLLLYYSSRCGYCYKVLSFLKQNNISIPMKNVVENSDIREELRTITGKTQVPCLMIDGEPMHESDDIVEWLAANRSNK